VVAHFEARILQTVDDAVEAACCRYRAQNPRQAPADGKVRGGVEERVDEHAGVGWREPFEERSGRGEHFVPRQKIHDLRDLDALEARGSAQCRSHALRVDGAQVGQQLELRIQPQRGRPWRGCRKRRGLPDRQGLSRQPQHRPSRFRHHADRRCIAMAQELRFDHAEIQAIEPPAKGEGGGFDDQDDGQKARRDRSQWRDQQQLDEAGPGRFARTIAGDVEKRFDPAPLGRVHGHEQQLVGAPEQGAAKHRLGGAHRGDERPALEDQGQCADDPDPGRQYPDRTADPHTLERIARAGLCQERQHLDATVVHREETQQAGARPERLSSVRLEKVVEHRRAAAGQEDQRRHRPHVGRPNQLSRWRATLVGFSLARQERRRATERHEAQRAADVQCGQQRQDGVEASGGGDAIGRDAAHDAAERARRGDPAVGGARRRRIEPFGDQRPESRQEQRAHARQVQIDDHGDGAALPIGVPFD